MASHTPHQTNLLQFSVQQCSSVKSMQHYKRVLCHDNSNNGDDVIIIIIIIITIHWSSVLTMLESTFQLTLGCQGGSPSLCDSYDIIQGDQKVSVHLKITIQKVLGSI
jgi:hypothetical protein